VCHDQNVVIALPKRDRPVVAWDCVELLEPLLDEAQHQATELGHDYIGSAHLVLAIAKLADPRLSALLRDCGVTHEKVRGAVIKLLQPEA
jgi:ATP-dependent Clp protease ATP-binding subunit ClpA